MNRVRVGTYNVHKCKGIDWRVSPARIADVIFELKADLLAVHEILLSQAECISSRLQIPFTFGTARQHAGEPYGNAAFTNLPVLSTESFDLSAKQREPRQCLCVSVSPGIHFFAVHLGTSFLERREQARLLVSPQVLQRPEFIGRRIVAGDFNEWTRGLATRMLTEHLNSADRRWNYPGLLPFMRLDHIYYDAAFHLSKMHLHRTPLSLRASDHLPLAADFEF